MEIMRDLEAKARAKAKSTADGGDAATAPGDVHGPTSSQATATAGAATPTVTAAGDSALAATAAPTRRSARTRAVAVANQATHGHPVRSLCHFRFVLPSDQSIPPGPPTRYD